MTTTNPFDAHAADYDSWYDENQALHEIELDAIGQILPPTSGGRRLEVGVGTGRFAGPLGFTDGVDPGEKLLELAAATGITVAVGVAEKLPYPDDSFEVVGVFTALEFFSDPHAGLLEIRRVLQPGGSLVVSYINPTSATGQLIAASKADDRYFAGATFRTPAEMTELLAKAGFGVRETRQVRVTAGSPSVILPGNTTELYCILRAEVVS